MRRKILFFALLVAMLTAIFALSVSAKEWTYKDEAGTTYLTLTIDDSSQIVTESEGRFPMWNEKNEPLTWYVIATDEANGVKTVKSFVSTDPAYTNHGNNYFRFIKEADFKVEGYPVRSVYSVNDLPDYESWDYKNCPLCKKGVKLDALINCHGYSAL